MKRCYEQEWYEIATGCKENGNHCGDHVTFNGVDYCPYDGKLKDYFGWCADIEPPPRKTEKYEQLSFFDNKNQI